MEGIREIFHLHMHNVCLAAIPESQCSDCKYCGYLKILYGLKCFRKCQTRWNAFCKFDSICVKKSCNCYMFDETESTSFIEDSLFSFNRNTIMWLSGYKIKIFMIHCKRKMVWIIIYVAPPSLQSVFGIIWLH